MLVTHSSGSGIALDISKGGNGEGLRVTKTSGSGNAVTITGGALSAVAGQFSGDVQTATRFAASSGSNGITITPNVGGTQNRIETTGSLPLSLVSAAAITMAAGGTTPQITLTTSGNVGIGTASSNIASGFTNLVVGGSSNGIIYVNRDSGARGYFYANGTTSVVLGTTEAPLILQTDDTDRLTLASTGAATFSSSVTATRLTASNSTDLLLNLERAAVGAWGFNVTSGGNLFLNNRFGTNVFHIADLGNVGIGTASPFHRLSVSNAANGVIASFGNNVDADLLINLTSGVTLLTPTTGTLAFLSLIHI